MTSCGPLIINISGDIYVSNESAAAAAAASSSRKIVPVEPEVKVTINEEAVENN